jgi:hypothetical protein
MFTKIAGAVAAFALVLATQGCSTDPVPPTPREVAETWCQAMIDCGIIRQDDTLGQDFCIAIFADPPDVMKSPGCLDMLRDRPENACAFLEGDGSAETRPADCR